MAKKKIYIYLFGQIRKQRGMKEKAGELCGRGVWRWGRGGGSPVQWSMGKKQTFEAVAGSLLPASVCASSQGEG